MASATIDHRARAADLLFRRRVRDRDHPAGDRDPYAARRKRFARPGLLGGARAAHSELRRLCGELRRHWRLLGGTSSRLLPRRTLSGSSGALEPGLSRCNCLHSVRHRLQSCIRACAFRPLVYWTWLLLTALLNLRVSSIATSPPMLAERRVAGRCRRRTSPQPERRSRRCHVAGDGLFRALCRSGCDGDDPACGGCCWCGLRNPRHPRNRDSLVEPG